MEELPIVTDTRLQFLGDEEEYWIYGFGDLVFRTETLSTARADRVIPLGEAAGRIMDYMVRHQDEIRGARILEPFCGCGPMALLALHLDASHVCAVDINPRALEFLDDNCRRNLLDASRLYCVLEDIASYAPDEQFDWLFANPPFVPTPEGIDGAIHSAAGGDGNRLSSALMSRLDVLLRATGQALMSIFQIEAGGEPLLARECEQLVPTRPVEFTKGNQFRDLAFGDFAEGYRERVPYMRRAIDAWEDSLVRTFGTELTVDTYAVHIGAKSAGSGVTFREYDGSKYGHGFFKPRKSAKGVAHENLPEKAHGTDSR